MASFIIIIYLLKIVSTTALIIKNNIKVQSVFTENTWALDCDFWKRKKIKKRINGVNVILPLEVRNIEILENNRFYIVQGNDTIILRGNRTLKTSYHNEFKYKNLLNAELVVVNKKGCVQKYKLEKE